MKKVLMMLAGLVLATATAVTPAPAQVYSVDPAIGTWTFYVSINGAPPCQCIQLSRFRADGTLDGPGNDQFSGQALGEWKRSTFRDISFAFVQNSFNPDGTAGGVYTIRGTMTLNSSGDSATGTSSFTLVDNSGKVLATGTATFKATRLKLDQ
jgi:hypothetical protein